MEISIPPPLVGRWSTLGSLDSYHIGLAGGLALFLQGMTMSFLRYLGLIMWVAWMSGCFTLDRARWKSSRNPGFPRPGTSRLRHPGSPASPPPDGIPGPSLETSPWDFFHLDRTTCPAPEWPHG